MTTGFKLSDGRDLSDIFSAGDAGITVGFQTSNGTDLGRQFMSGSTGVVTGFRDPSGVDLGSRFGNGPSEASGWKKVTGVPLVVANYGDDLIMYGVGKTSSGPYISAGCADRNYFVSVNSNLSASAAWLNDTQFDLDDSYNWSKPAQAQAALQMMITACNAKKSITAWYK